MELPSPSMLTRRDDVLDLHAALKPRCATWKGQILEYVDVWYI